MLGQQTNLSLSDIESFRGQGSGRRSGKWRRYYCPVHGSKHQKSLAVNHSNGYFKCHKCGCWGYLEEKKQKWLEDRRNDEKRFKSPLTLSSPGNTPRIEMEGLCGDSRPMEISKKLSLEQYGRLKDNLPKGNAAIAYLKNRRIPLDIAVEYGGGFAVSGTWRGRAPKYPRIVFPHTTPDGTILNLYGRTTGDNVPKKYKHDHLKGNKGIFNAKALSADTVYICEGVFDALSLIAAGYSNSCAIFGVNNLRWGWVKASNIIFALDQDAAGAKWQSLAWEGIVLGKKVYFLPPEIYQGFKDLNEVWSAKGSLNISLAVHNGTVMHS